MRTTAMVNLAGIMERTDEQLLPAVYRFVGASFNASPSQLGYITLSRAMVQALASPLGGVLGEQPRKGRDEKGRQMEARKGQG
jgi:hypothetical protein